MSYELPDACARALIEAAERVGVEHVTFGVMIPDSGPLGVPWYSGVIREDVSTLRASLSTSEPLADQVSQLRNALERAHAELDDILEDWQLEGRHGQPRYEQLKRETQAAEDVLRGAVPQSASIDTVTGNK